MPKKLVLIDEIRKLKDVSELEPGQKIDFEAIRDKLVMVKVEYLRNPKAKVRERQKRECAHRIEQGKSLHIYTGELIAVGKNKKGFWYICVRAQQRRNYAKDDPKRYKWAYRSLSENGGTFLSISRL